MRQRTKGLIAIVAFLTLWFGLSAFVVKCHAEDVFEFKDWYGVYTPEIGKQLVGFSHSDDSQISIYVDEQLIVTIKVYGKADPVSDVEVWVDSGKGTTVLDYRLTHAFAKGYKAKVQYVDTNGETHREVFSLKGFSKGYKWLLK